MTPRAHFLLRFDSGAGALAGLTVVALHRWLATLYGLPDALVLFLGVTNLVYASFSGTLAWRARRWPPSRRRVVFLAGANVAWGVACVVLALLTWPTATALGSGLLLFEAGFVSALGLAELRWVRP